MPQFTSIKDYRIALLKKRLIHIYDFVAFYLFPK